VIGPKLHGLAVAPRDRTLDEFVDEYLDSLKATREPRTVKTQRVRLAYATREFGDVNLSDLERRAQELARWRATLSPGMRYPCMSALRQCLDVAARWGLMSQNPAKLAGPNPQPKIREVEPFTIAEVDAIATELADDDGAGYGPLVVFAAETGLRPEEWIPLERRDWLRQERVVVVERTYSDGRLARYGKTAGSRRRVPLSPRAEEALRSLPARIDTRLLFPALRGGYIELHGWRNREWYPALEAAGLAKRGPYALRHTFATTALAAGLSVFELARVMGSSVEMIDRTYGHLAAGSEQHMRDRLAAYAQRLGHERAATAEAQDR
jgi:integrase